MPLDCLDDFGLNVRWTQKPIDKLGPKGSRGILLGHLASNISRVWDPNTDKIQRIADGRVDEGLISLSKIQIDEKNPMAASETHKVPNDQDDFINIHVREIDLRPAKGFMAYTPNPSPFSNTPSIPQ